MNRIECWKSMKSSFNVLLNGRYRSLFLSYRFVSNKSPKKFEGLRERFDEDEARVYFDKWLKSLWFAPGGWTQSTRDNAITVTKRYLPFWNLSLNGSINSSVNLSQTTTSRSGKHFVSNDRWNNVSMKVNNVCLNNLNIYAAQTLDRYHLNQLNICFNNYRIVNLNNEENAIEQWTVDKETAFHIGWDLNIVPQLKHLCIEQAKQAYPQFDNHQVESFHFDINSKKENLLYYPIYVINYQYGSQSNYTCLVDGITGQVTGDRQYSFIKVSLTTLIAFYPMALTALVTLGSFIDPSIGIALASLLSFTNSLPFAFILAPLLGLYAKHYPKSYRQRINQQQWINYRSNASQFTYDFTTPFQQQYQSYQQQQNQQQRESESRSKREEEVPMDLYKLLSIDRTANEKEIKRAYLIKAKELHPDKNPGDKKAEELFKRVNQAYSILSNKYQREQYDKYGYESVKYN